MIFITRLKTMAGKVLLKILVHQKGVDGGPCEPGSYLVGGEGGGEANHGKNRGCKIRKEAVEDKLPTCLQW